MKYLVALVLATAVYMHSITQVQAHVLFVDKNTNVAAVFHSNPNDDPIAGENSELFFDIQDASSSVRIPYSGYDLMVTNETGERTTISTTASGTSVKAEYVFPSQGLYKLSLRSQPKYDQFQKVVIEGSLRINRGIGSSQVVQSNALPTTGLIVSLTALAMLAIVFSNNRQLISRKSTF